MSDPRNRDPQPDAAALDELRRAFGDPDRPPPVEPDDDRTQAGPTPLDADEPGEPDERDDLPGEPDDLSEDLDAPDESDPGPRAESDDGSAELAALVTAEAPIDAPEPTPEAIAQPTPPRIIRIDDITGAVGPSDASGAPAAPVAPDAADPATDEGAAPGVAPTVIAIDADDLPDALYVAGSLEGDSSRSIVFIEDDLGGDALTPESDRDLRRGIEPRMRERRVQVRRAQSRKRLRWVVAAFALVLVGIGLLAVLGSDLFAVRADDVAVSGAVYTDREELQTLIDDLVGTPTLLVDTRAAEAQLERIAWVEQAKVTASFPHDVSIEIRERQAMATYQGPDGRFRVIDREGRVLDVLDDYPIAYVLIRGTDPIDLAQGEFVSLGYAAAAELAKNLTGSVRGRVDYIEVTANGSSLTMWLDDGSDVRFGEARDLFTKLVRLETLLATEPDRVPGPIDVSTN